MIKLVIIEDEIPATRLLEQELKHYTEPIVVERIITSVSDAISYFTQAPLVDLVLMDINLSDGQSFSIFEHVEIKCPVIFITGFDQFMLEAFQHNGIEYILKPIERVALMGALDKYKKLKHYMHSDISEIVHQAGIGKIKKTMFVVKKGVEHCLLKTQSIAYFFSDSKIVFAVDSENRKFILEGFNLTDLMNELEETVFYRVNRKYILNINFVKKYKIVDRVKLSFELCIPMSEEIIMGQISAGKFRIWIRSL